MAGRDYWLTIAEASDPDDLLSHHTCRRSHCRRSPPTDGYYETILRTRI